MKKKAVAIIEDEAPVRAALAALLRALGFHATPYESAEAFMQALPVAELDCIVMDQNLPGKSGLALSQYLRERNIDTAQVMITATDEPTIRDRCKDRGIPLLIKPITAALLSKTIEAAVQERTINSRPH
jgi:FixJ family two-component response regulator